MERFPLSARALVILVGTALVIGSTATFGVLRYVGALAEGRAAAAAHPALRADEMLQLHRDQLALLHKLEARERAICLMLGDYTKASVWVMDLCR